jgi:hypothetical protein
MNYNRLVPRDSFMGRFLSYMESQETAYAYDWWCGLWTISAACGRSTFVARPRAPVYLNMYVILVGDSGVVRKTTSVHNASTLVRSLLDTYRNLSLLDAKLTPEKLDELLHTQTINHGTAQLCITAPELAVFLGTERYIAHMPTLLTDLYDCPDARDGGGTVTRGSVTQRKVWVHFLSASTPIWLLKTVNPNVIEGGFTSRCYFVVANEPKRRVPWPIEPDAALYSDLCDDLRIIAQEARQHPEIGIEPDALKFFTDWYEIRPRSIDPYKQSFEAREDAHVLRVAAVLAINEGTWCIHQTHLEHAITAVSTIKDSSARIFDRAEVTSKFAIGLDILRTHLINSGMSPMSRAHLYLRVRQHLTNADFINLLEVLQDMGAIQRFELRGNRGRPTDYIRGTQLLLDRKIGEHVIERFT